MCGIASCWAGWGNCDGNVTNGCETNTTNKVQHCGACGTVCPSVPHGTTVCASSMCAVGTCSVPYANCNLVFNDGCEINTSSNVQHCGGCNQACPPVANGIAACASSNCTIGSCIPPYANCNLLYSDGCEVNINTNAAHCGGCNRPCPVGNFCSGGICIVG